MLRRRRLLTPKDGAFGICVQSLQSGAIQRCSTVSCLFARWTGCKTSGSPICASKLGPTSEGRRADRFGNQLYRTEAFAEAGDIYDQLGATEFSSESADIGINRRAVETQLLCLGSQSQIKPRKPGRQDLEAFEFAYNAACSSIAQGALRQAEMLLRRAEGWAPGLLVAVELSRLFQNYANTQKISPMMRRLPSCCPSMSSKSTS